MSENNYPVKVNEAELKAKLDSLSYDVLRNAATERPFTGEYTDTDKVGVYKCKACAAELFRSETKAGLDPIVSEILIADGVEYFMAEEYHQKYLQKNPNGYDCHSSTGVAFPVGVVL